MNELKENKFVQILLFIVTREVKKKMMNLL